MTKIYLVRHGQSQANLDRVFAGRYNPELSDLGRAQAQKVGDYLKDKGIEKIYASPLKRAFNTAVPLSTGLNIPIIPYDGIVEINGGDWEGKEIANLIAEFPETYGIWMTDIGHSKCDNGESMAEVQERMVKAVGEIAKKEDGKTIALFAHAGCLRAFITHCLKLPLSGMQDLGWLSNASVTEINFSDGEFEVIDMDYSGHLGDMVTTLPPNV